MSTTLDIYEIRLREEFSNLRKLQNHPSVNRILTISYTDRRSGNRKSVQENPSSTNLYPEEYFVLFTLPIYVGSGRLDKQWSGELKLKVSRAILMDPNSEYPPEYDLDTSRGLPFNQHIAKEWVCIGGVWSVSKDFGLWYFIIGIGGLLNQESVWMSDDGTGHLNPDAYNYWKNERNKQPINNIKWPYTLSGLTIGEAPQHKPPVFKVGTKKETPKFRVGGHSEKRPTFKVKK